ncbi:phosphoribosylaminoimidazole carboxylase [Saccharata proteae CBS 121410]|uniref:Phosphoribosylaminoimidazole carboxylase n=1 Tax=Saccharata proteae CBS 121410 TaxID=1314787 RepID=A0A9P4LXU8_9PEZI|nr:phosphoribosylaminoimidazole carboxylase [Saccharata proteae CBS 121410]
MTKTVGILGGGQLGRMLVEPANRLKIPVNILDSPGAPAKQISAHSGHVDGSFKDPESIKKLAKTCDVITVEIEHIDTKALEEIEGTVELNPHWSTIRIIQDKFAQKEHLQSHGVAVAESKSLDHATEDDLKAVGSSFGYPFMLKSKTEAYDGKGNYPVKSEASIPDALKQLGNRPLYAEKWANFKMELAVMVVKTKDSTLAYPTTETIHENSICKLTYTPARGVSRETLKQAEALAKKAVSTFKGKGIFGVEMFLNQDDTLLINEIAPRPHNSGHYTIEGTHVSQFEAHLRAITDLPLSEADLQLREPAAIMLNVLGGTAPDSHIQIYDFAKQSPRIRIHDYGKAEARPGRKMGHLTVTAASMSEAETLIQPLIDAVDRQSGKISSSSPTTSPKASPLVAIIMGSDSDLPVLAAAFNILNSFNVPYETRITSAHRTPGWMYEYVTSAESRGIRCIIAAAGGAAHLPGMAAALTVLPVIGIPVKASVLDGVDSLYSIVQMPRGEPVATVGIGNSTNAALLAIRVLSTADARLREGLHEFEERNRREVLEKDRRLMEMGPERYLEAMKK